MSKITVKKVSVGKRLPDRGGIQAYSAGTTDHDAVPVKAISEVLKYMNCVLQQPADDSAQAEVVE